MIPGDKPGTAVLDQTTAAMKNVSTATATFGVDVTALDLGDQELLQAQLMFSGPMEVKDVYDPQTVRQDLNMRGELQVQGTTLSVNADLKLDGDIVYFNVRQLPVLPNLDLTTLQNQWIKVESESSTSADEVRTPQQTAELEAAFKDLLAASEVGQARRETISGTGVFVVDVMMPDEALLTYAQRVSEITNPDEALTETQVAEMQNFLDATEPITATLWIDRSTYYLLQAELPFVVNVQQLQAMRQAELSDEEALGLMDISPAGATAELKTLQVNFSFGMENFNQPVTFEVPADARDFQEVLGEVFGFAGLEGMSAFDEDFSGMDAAYPSMWSDPSTSGVPTGARPTELPELSPEELEILRQYGVDIDNL
jgi:hypothetical protein